MIIKNHLNLVIVAIFLFFLFFFNKEVKAQILETNIEREILIENKNSAKIIEKRERYLLTSEYFLDLKENNFYINIINLNKSKTATENLFKELKNGKLYNENKETINFLVEITKDNDFIVKPIYSRKLNFGEKSILYFEYNNPNIIYPNGMLVDIYVNGFSKDFKFENEFEIFKIKYFLKINKSLGEISLIQPEKVLNNIDNFIILEYDARELVNETIWIQIGNKQAYKFLIEQEYSETSSIPILFNEFTILIPKNVLSGNTKQTIFIKNIHPKPFYIETDVDDNVIATFKIPANQTGKIKIEGYAILEKIDFSIHESGNLSMIDQKQKTGYTSSSIYWESDADEIKKYAQEIFDKIKTNNIDEKSEIYLFLKEAYKFVVERIDYSTTKKYGLNERQGALRTLLGSAAVCMEYSDLLIALLRSVGIPARAAFGHAYSSIQYSTLTDEDKTINHQWVEVYFPKQKRWVPVDPTWGENGTEVIGGDLNRFYLYHASINPNIPSPVKIKYIGDKEFTPKKQTFLVEVLENYPDFGNDIKQINEIIQLFPRFNQEIEDIERIKFTVSYIFDSLDREIENLIIKIIGQQPKNTLNIIKIFLVLYIIIIIISLLSFIRITKKNRKL